MANHEINKEYSEELRKIETTDPVHADTLNPLYGQLINNDAYLKEKVDEHQADNTPHREAATLYRKNKDENDIYALLEWYRADGTLFKTSELEGESPQYATRRVKFYAKDGQTLVQEVVYSLTYDENGELISEVIQT